jgi:hypothetical protein
VASTIHDTPAIAALPFDNLSDDPPQRFIVGDITNDLFGEPSRLDDVLDFERDEFEFQVEQIPTSAEQLAALNKPEAAAGADNPAEVVSRTPAKPATVAPSPDKPPPDRQVVSRPPAKPATVAPTPDQPSSDRQIVSRPPAKPATVAPSPDQPSSDRQVVSRTPADKSARATPDDGWLLSHWQLRSDIVRTAIAKSRPEISQNHAVFGEFEIVQATPVNSNNQLVELKIVYTMEYAPLGTVNFLEIDKVIIFHQTIIVDGRSLTVLKVGEAVAGGDAPERIIEVNAGPGGSVFDSNSTQLTEDTITGNSSSGVLLARNSSVELLPSSGGTNFIEGNGFYGLNCANELFDPLCHN